MRTRQDSPANDPHAPTARTGADGLAHDLEERLDALLRDRRTRRMLRDDRRARELILRVSRVLRRERAEARPPR